MSPKETRKLELECLWRSKLRQAQLDCDDAAARTSEALEALHQGLLPRPDAVDAVTKALQVELGAFRKLNGTLTTFMDIVLEGKLPPPE